MCRPTVTEVKQRQKYLCMKGRQKSAYLERDIHAFYNLCLGFYPYQYHYFSQIST